MDDINSEDITESVGLGCALEKFSESQDILNMIDNVKTLDDSLVEKTYEHFRYIVNQYKEQPHLLDSHLSLILDKIVAIVKTEDVPFLIKHRAFQYMQLVTNVRGYKIVVQHLPHDASDLEPVLAMLEAQDQLDTSAWETRYCLLLWLSIIVKIPFHMSKLDGSDGSDPNFKPIMQRIIDVCKQYLLVGDSSRGAAAFLVSHFLTRSDIKEVYLLQFLEWAFHWITKTEDYRTFLGPLFAVAAILKNGKRDDILPHAPWLLSQMLSIEWKSQPYRLARKFTVKIIQRIGLTFLKVRVITWRYQRGNRSLDSDLPNLCSGDDFQMQESSNVPASYNSRGEEDDQDVPSEIEEVLEELIQALKDPDITIRWSAAKGIGRIMGRMNKHLGDEVIGCVLSLLNPRENDCAWHGGCLTLAELSKRGLLLPSRLPEVIPLVKKALVYDEPKGYASVGVHVRDAACYVCWTFARAYDSEIFKPYVRDIANALVIAACFDREINIRKAASAAFQEHIGRQGTFPHGIDIMTNADYFSVGVRSNAYLNISVFIAQYEEYTTSLIDHLINKKIEHWDVVIRELSANALHNLTPKAPNYMVDIGLPILFQKMNSIDVNVRHGSIMAAAEIIHALSFIDGVTIGEDIQTGVKELVRLVKERQQFKGMSGELMKIACCHLIHKCSLSKLPIHRQEVIDDWQNLIDECLCHEVGNIRSKAATALSSLCSEYYNEDGVVLKEKACSIVAQYTEKLKANDEIGRIGHALALGSLPPAMILGNMNFVVNSLIDCATISVTSEKWVESRRTAIKALSSICSSVATLEDGWKESCKAYIPAILECFIEGLKDYTTDDRGDTGAWVRESSMSGIQIVMQLAAVHTPSLLTEDVVKRAFCGIVQQAVERIDRTRALAGTVFSSLLHNSPEITNIPERNQIIEIFTPEVCKTEIIWLSLNTFPKFMEMLSLHTYTYSLMMGLIISVGGLTESLVNASSASFFSYLRSQPFEELMRICDIIVKIYEANLKNNRIVLPMLSFLERLLSSGAIRPILDCPNTTFAVSVLSLTKTALNGCLEKFKLIGSVDVYCQLIQVKGDVCRNALQRIMILLCHRFAWLRKVTATKFYEALMTYGDDMGCSEDPFNSALTIVSDTEWSDLTLEEVRPLRNELSALFNIPIPTQIRNPKVQGKT